MPHPNDQLLREQWRVNPAVRLLPPASVANDTWQAANLVTKSTFALGRHAAALCGVLLSPLAGSNAVRMVALAADVDESDIAAQLETLVDKGLVIHSASTDDGTEWIDRLMLQWRRYGWSEAADHHLATFDYPYYDYSDDGWRRDKELMSSYRSAQADEFRFKPRYGGAVTFAAPAVQDVLTGLTTPLHDCVRHRGRAATVGERELLALCSAVFGITKTRPRGPAAAPTIRRTSPSGGARHPSECYVCVIDVPGIPAGWYHFATGEHTLVRIADSSQEQARRLLFGVHRARFPVRAVLVLTSQFERNMYRYREPRTFRTIFMDVGHLVATTEMVSVALGLSMYGQHGIDDRGVDEVLGLDRLDEGVIYSVAVGDGAPPRDPLPEND